MNTGLVGGPDVLRLQGAFAVYRANQELDRYFPIALNGDQITARHRIKSVEITTSIDKIHIAKITFVDPEYSVMEALLEAWNYQNVNNPLAEAWTVKIGYFDMPESTWATMSGIPQVADYKFPRKGPPTITIVLFAPIIALKKNRTPGGHHLAAGTSAPSLKRALNNIASNYGLSLNLGSLSEVVDLVDQVFQAQVDSPSEEIKQYFDGNGDALGSFRKISQLDNNHNMANDLLYLESVAQELANIYIKLNGDKTTATDIGSVSDQLWTSVANADDTPVVEVRGGTLYVCLMKDLIKDLGKVTLYSYREGERTLLEFRPVLSQSENQTASYTEQYGVEDPDIFARNYGVVARHLASDSLKPPEHTPNIPAMQTSSMDYASPSDPKVADIRALQPPKGIYFSSALTGQPYNKEITLEWLVGALATNIKGEAVVIGTPWMRAGRLVGFTGLARGPETPSSSQNPQLYAILSRIYQVVECTHHMDETGFYWTRLTVQGATTDSSLAVLKEAFESGAINEDDVKARLRRLAEEGKSLETEEEGETKF